METMFFAVVDRGKANAVLRKAQQNGAAGGTIFLGEGTIQSKLLEKIGLTETHKELLAIAASEELCHGLHEMVCETFLFSKKNRGIAFSIPFRRRQPQSPGREPDNRPGSENSSFSHSCIVIIVDRGRSMDCIKAARDAGAGGGTLIHGRGAGIPTEFYFPLVIEPQKDIVMIITTKDKAASIRDRISAELDLEKPGSGIIFTLPVLRTSGLFENRTAEHEERTP
ncbi:MAG TPA: P-II family nitrogen regulator [Firmicutes bacterium]|jgi:hypothetical protein|nr:P-II family nitrogen regulator [Bacillota bacterium]